MTLKNFINKIGLPEDACEAVLSYEITNEECARLEDLYDTDYDALEREINDMHPENPHLGFLAICCRWALKSLSLWQEKGIPEEIAIDTFRDITIWSNRLRDRIPGRIGLIEWKWFRIHKAAKLFRLGRLQFEPIEFKDDVTLPDGTEIRRGTPVLSIHIPRGESMTAESIKDSFDMSKEFFPKYFGISYDTYACTSWLLAPALGDMVKENSGIALFRKYFHIYGEELGYSQAEDYVFVTPNPDKSAYPEDTSLQRNLKKFLMDGGTMGMGKGIGKY